MSKRATRKELRKIMDAEDCTFKEARAKWVHREGMKASEKLNKEIKRNGHS